MADIKITGLNELENKIERIYEMVASVKWKQGQEPEMKAMMACINAMQAAIEDLILAYEDVAGATDISKKARHAMNAAQIILKPSPFNEWGFPEEVDEENVTKARPLVKKSLPVKKAAKKKAPVKKGKRK